MNLYHITGTLVFIKDVKVTLVNVDVYASGMTPKEAIENYTGSLNNYDSCRWWEPPVIELVESEVAE